LWLVVGLGNPGDEYAATRHNAGFMAVDRLAASWGVELRGRLFKARTALAWRGGEEVLLLEPKTFMNRSGTSVRAALAGKGLAPERLLVVYDDLTSASARSGSGSRGGPGPTRA
jgi:PTH1 family peptidyl-tRNA hydrolase